MRAVLIGAVDSSRVAMAALRAAPDWVLAQIVTLSPQLRHRHSDFVDLEALASPGITVATADNINQPEIIDLIAQARPDHIFVIGWSQICGPELMAIAPGRMIGYHPAPLPRLRGRAAIPWTILDEEPITAGTLFWVDAGTDTGAILDQQFFHVAPDETAMSLYRRHMDALALMLDRTLPMLAEGKARRDAQEERFATWAARRRPEDGRIDWQRGADDVARLVRAVGRPYPGAFTDSAKGRILIWSAHVEPMGPRHAAIPGQVVIRDDLANGFVVACGARSALRVTEWEGKMPALHTILGRAE